MVSVFFMISRIKQRLPCKLNRKGSLLSLYFCHGSKIIFFRRHRRLNGRHQSCGCLSCYGRPSLSYGYRHCSCLSCVPSSTRSFLGMNCCYGCSCHSTSCRFCPMNWVCCSCRYLNQLMTDAMRKNLVGAHIQSWSAKDGCCWARYSFGADCFGCSCWRCCSMDGCSKHFPGGHWCWQKDGRSPWDEYSPTDGCLRWQVC